MTFCRREISDTPVALDIRLTCVKSMKAPSLPAVQHWRKTMILAKDATHTKREQICEESQLVIRPC